MKNNSNPLFSINENKGKLHIEFFDNYYASILFGEHNKHLKIITKALDISINARGNSVFIEADNVNKKLAKNLLIQLYGLVKDEYPLFETDIEYALRIISNDHLVNLKEIFLKKIFITTTNRAITPKSKNQRDYIEAIRNYDITFGIGPAGTGKTYLAMAMAVAALSKGLINRIVLARPAVEAGETLGFLPGDLADKVNPYLRPLYDALHNMMKYEKASDLLDKGVIEVAPLAFMRGRTLDDSFIILDEAQNTTSMQMKMFLTRIGFNSKAVITGDITQIDLPEKKSSGLIEANNILKNIKGISFIYFSEKDVVRHKLVQQIIQAYDNLNKK